MDDEQNVKSKNTMNTQKCTFELRLNESLRADDRQWHLYSIQNSRLTDSLNVADARSPSLLFQLFLAFILISVPRCRSSCLRLPKSILIAILKHFILVLILSNTGRRLFPCL